MTPNPAFALLLVSAIAHVLLDGSELGLVFGLVASVLMWLLVEAGRRFRIVKRENPR